MSGELQTHDPPEPKPMMHATRLPAQLADAVPMERVLLAGVLRGHAPGNHMQRVTPWRPVVETRHDAQLNESDNTQETHLMKSHATQYVRHPDVTNIS